MKSQNLRARSQRRHWGCAARRTLQAKPILSVLWCLRGKNLMHSEICANLRTRPMASAHVPPLPLRKPPQLVNYSSALHRTPQHTANPIAKPYVSAFSVLSGFDLLQRLFSASSSAPPRLRVKHQPSSPVFPHAGFPIPFHHDVAVA